jgi:hypothetical protein
MPAVEPVFMHWLERNPPSLEVKKFTNFKVVDKFADSVFTPPNPCPIAPQ